MRMPQSHSDHVTSPGMGMTPEILSRDPLASEGEATPGPDDYNPFEDYSNDTNPTEGVPDTGPENGPTEGSDPFAFDDVAPGLPGHSFF